MTDAEWLASDNPGRMRGEIRCRSFSPLCWVWFDLGCVRRVADLFANRRCSELVEAMDAWASDPNRYRYQSFHQEQAAVGEAERRLSRGRDDPLREARSAAVLAARESRSSPRTKDRTSRTASR